MEQWGIMTTISTVVSLGIGIISYFLKRTMNQVDRHGDEIRRIDGNSISKNDLKENTDELKKDIRQIREDYTPKSVHEKDFDECRGDIKEIRDDYLKQDDFIREFNKMDRKLDKVLEIIMKK